MVQVCGVEGRVLGVVAAGSTVVAEWGSRWFKNVTATPQCVATGESDAVIATQFDIECLRRLRHRAASCRMGMFQISQALSRPHGSGVTAAKSDSSHARAWLYAHLPRWYPGSGRPCTWTGQVTQR